MKIQTRIQIHRLQVVTNGPHAGNLYDISTSLQYTDFYAWLSGRGRFGVKVRRLGYGLCTINFDFSIGTPANGPRVSTARLHETGGVVVAQARGGKPGFRGV